MILIFDHIGGVAYEHLQQETFAPGVALRSSALCLLLYHLTDDYLFMATACSLELSP